MLQALEPVFPFSSLILIEPLMRQRIAIHHRHLMARVKRPFGDRGPHPAAANDHDKHGRHSRDIFTMGGYCDCAPVGEENRRIRLFRCTAYTKL